MAYDSARQVMVARVATETWEWNGSSWSLRGLIAQPHNSTSEATITYDSVRQRMVLVWGDTPFEWDGTVTGWIPVVTALRPPFEFNRAAVYETSRQRLFMFGGYNGQGQEGYESWSWDGANWSDLNPPTSPSPRQGHAMAYDSVADRVILFGGRAGEDVYADTWAWDGTNWFQLSPTTIPPARHEHSMAYDSTRSRVFMFGGEDENGAPLNDSWEWDGENWFLVNPPSRPAARFSASMDYDAARDVMVLFSGSNGAFLRDTWEYTAGGSASYTTFGTGCPGPQGIPTLGPPFGGSVPIAGQSFSVQVNNLPLDATTWMLLGPSTTQYGLLTLPYDLGNIGIFGCTLWVSGEFVFPVPSVLGVGLWTLDIPAFAAGWTFHNQAVVFDTTGNVMVSDGGTLVIGG